jgi:DNA-directed RNA polymerase subunit RPC12/RpoP
MKCDLCGKEIEETFLGKLKGTILKTIEKGRNKLSYICSECQKKRAEEKLSG